MAPITKTLDLSKLLDTITVDAGNGVRLNLRAPEQLPPVKAHAFAVLGNRIDALTVKAELSEDEQAELEALPKKVLGFVAPPEEVERLTDDQAWAVCRFFTLKSREAMLTPAQEAASGSTTSTGAGS